MSEIKINDRQFMQKSRNTLFRLSKIVLYLGFYLSFVSSLNAQTRMLEGIVRDSVSKEPLPYVSVYFKGTTTGVMTDEHGAFRMEAKPHWVLNVSCVGYKEFSLPVSHLKKTTIEINLHPSQYLLNEVVIKPKKEKYSKKGNPAVEFVQNIIDNRKKKDPHTKDYYSYQRYEKLTYALNDFDSIQQKNWLYRKFKFLQNYIDTSEIGNKPILPVSIKELIENNYYSKSPKLSRKVIEAYRKDGVDEILSEEGMDAFFGEAFKEIDLYQNDISLFLLRFVSPISSMGPGFYKYYLNDTIDVDGVKCRDLSFVPMVSESLGFTGHLYVTLDSSFFVKKAVLNIPHKINLNYVDNMTIIQEFDRTQDSIRILKKDDIAIEFKLTEKSKGVYARRINTYSNYVFTPPDQSVFASENHVIILPDAKEKDKEYWMTTRHIPIKDKEDNVKKLMSELHRAPLYSYSEKIISILVNGFIPTAAINSKFDIGPVSTLISGNSFEGARFRFGGSTTAALNKRWFTQGYLAYGTKDKRLKYSGQLEYSFIDKDNHEQEFPIHSIRASYTYDINQLGQQYKFVNKDNILLSLKRQSDDRITYMRKVELSYQREYFTGLSYCLKLRNKTEYATHCMQFDQLNADGTIRPRSSFMMTEGELRLRYSPGEKYYQTKAKRISITRDAPVFHLSHIAAKKGFLGSDYTYNRTEFGFEKRFWLSAYGSVITSLNAGKVWNRVPFPMLIIPNANLTYTIQPQSYSLMNAVEFINDEYVSWDFTYYPNGWLFNRVPLLKKLKLREVASFRGMFGNLSNKNLPGNNQDLYAFPPGAYRMNKTPYMEAAVGITNILKLFRIDYVWRLTYRDHPNISKSGVRIGVEVSF